MTKHGWIAHKDADGAIAAWGHPDHSEVVIVPCDAGYAVEGVFWGRSFRRLDDAKRYVEDYEFLSV